MSNIQKDIQIQRLFEALKAAQYYISRLERYRDGKPVYDLGEAQSGYEREALPLIAAYEKEGQ